MGFRCGNPRLVGLPKLSKSLIVQGFIIKKSKSVTAFRYTEVVQCACDLTSFVFYSQSDRPEVSWLAFLLACLADRRSASCDTP